MIEVNGQQYQHATSTWTALTTGASFKLKTIQKCSYKVKAPKEGTNDAQGQIDGFTMKKQEHEAEIAMKLSEFLAWRAAIMGQNPGLGFLQCQFDFAVSYGNRINAMKTDTLRTCMAQEDPRESNDSQDADMVTLPLFFLKGDFADGPSVVYE